MFEQCYQKHIKKVITKHFKNVFRERYTTFQKNILGTKIMRPAENVLRIVGHNVRTMLSPNIIRMCLENVILPFRRTFWEPK